MSQESEDKKQEIKMFADINKILKLQESITIEDMVIIVVSTAHDKSFAFMIRVIRRLWIHYVHHDKYHPDNMKLKTNKEAGKVVCGRYDYLP